MTDDILCLSVEKIIYDKIHKLQTFADLVVPIAPRIYLLEDINHAIVVFPNNFIFNCNPRDYSLPISNKMIKGLIDEQIEPSIEKYEDYWNQIKSDNIIENDQNCILWSAYYLWWYYYGKDIRFPCSLMNLEDWMNDKQKVDELIKQLN